MKKKEKKRNFSDHDKFDRKQKKSSLSRQKNSSKHKYSIYDDFDEDELSNYSQNFDD